MEPLEHETTLCLCSTETRSALFIIYFVGGDCTQLKTTSVYFELFQSMAIFPRTKTARTASTKMANGNV